MFVASVSPSSSPASTTDTHPFPQTQYPLHGFTYSSVPLPGYNPPSSVMYNNPFGNYFPPFPHQGQHYYTSPNSSSGSNLMEKSNVLLSDGGSNSESECKVILPESHSDPKKNVLSAMPIKKRALSNVVKKPLEESKQNEEPPATSTNVEVKKKQPRTKDSPTKSDESEKKRKKVRDENEELKKKERRLVRNRQSAQASRERKKQYIQSLEAKVAELENKVRELEEENIELKKKQKP
ncbi:hypothetical protein C9374_008896 [Naegleria lovaniensis]|uniref:BZIP domain-containing protein n=1 Tax=Naegleria lovaniensis TaxID=51637 RepID=A0AA88GJX4_NAELO|nr:uncharacterized protein C9374_008896 [Naegleria lovaniensis]KAG2377811.1 hypothetical protein C9374_008896 [Naegleria lovaniensis]